jgi:uncharacterized protein (DUF885 family)
MQIPPAQMHASLNRALGILDDAWTELQGSPFVKLRMGVSPAHLPEVSLAEAARRSAVGRSLLQRVSALDLDGLPYDLILTLRLVSFRANTWSREADWYWSAVDPSGIGMFGLFLPTAYCGGYLLNSVHSQLASFRFQSSGDVDRYLALIADYERLIQQFTERTAGQATRGIYMPRVQVQQARALLAAFKANLRSTLGVAPQRLAILPASHFRSELEARIVSRVEPAFDLALEGLSDAYFAKASECVGIGQYPRGSEIYAELVKLNTTLDLTPEQVHARGLQRMSGIEASMRGIRAELGFKGDGPEFLAHLSQHAGWRTPTVEGVTAMFQRYIDRLTPRLREFFPTLPKATYGVAPLDKSLQGSMTFGYYDAPRKDRAEGRYLFNSQNLTQRPLLNIGALTYHELMPGHHLQLATQQESEGLHPFRKHSFVTAYVEGWAEYAATFAGEIGMYELPEERYGRLMMDAFLSSRLVVDTGMNALGWSLERARGYMRAHSGMSETEVLTESVRYSCDIPAQALAYKLADTQILAMRERMRDALGPRFDLKEFHAAILEPGALPMSDLEWHINHEIERLKECRAS